MNNKKNIATIIIGLVILVILLVLWFSVFRGIVSEIIPSDPGVTATTTQDYVPLERPLTVEEKKEVLDQLLPKNLVDTEEEIERRQAQLDSLQNIGGLSDQERLDQLNGLGGGVSDAEREKQLQDLANNGTTDE